MYYWQLKHSLLAHTVCIILSQHRNHISVVHEVTLILNQSGNLYINNLLLTQSLSNHSIKTFFPFIELQVNIIRDRFLNFTIRKREIKKSKRLVFVHLSWPCKQIAVFCFHHFPAPHTYIMHTQIRLHIYTSTCQSTATPFVVQGVNLIHGVPLYIWIRVIWEIDTSIFLNFLIWILYEPLGNDQRLYTTEELNLFSLTSTLFWAVSV